MGTTNVGRVISMLGLAIALIAPSAVRAQTVADPERAALFEAEAARLHQESTRWADAASLYLAAAAIRQHEDPMARQDLFIAANLYYQLGDRPAAVAALDSAGTRGLAAGDSAFATEMFANAASIAEEAGMVEQEARLRSRVADLARGRS